MKNSSTPPAAPDPTQTAQAQTASNIATANSQEALNLVNQNTPLGSLTYTPTGTGPGGVTTYTANETLTPEAQQSLELQQQVGNALSNLALSGTSQVSSAMGQPLNYNNLPTPGGINTSALTPITPYSTSGITAAPTSLDLGNLNMPTFNASELQVLPTPDQTGYKAASDALYGQATSRLDPQWAQASQEEATQLQNEGILPGSDAYNKAMTLFQEGKNDAYTSAQNSAVAGAENYATMENTNALADYNASLGTAQTEFGDQATNYGLGLNTATDQFSAEQQARNQQVAEALQATQASEQQQAQELGTQQAANTTALQNRQQGISEADYLRELPINEVSALLNGGQVTMPTFTNTPQTQVAGTNVAGITQNSFQDAYQNYQSQLQQQNAAIGAIFGGAGNVLGQWASTGFA